MYTKAILFIICLWITNNCLAQPPKTGNLERANDFTYTLASGEQETLYSLKSETVLLYFYDPTCEDCHVLMSRLETSELINRLIDESLLTVLAVYPEEDTEIWNEYTCHVPQKWINGYDKGVKIHTEGIFFIKSFPALYLLDKDKMILLKEMSFNELENELEQIYK